MATLLGDRAAMVAFLLEQLPGCTRWEASLAYDDERGRGGGRHCAAPPDQHRLNRQPVLSSRGKQRLRIRTVFMLALLYRERYGQLEQEAEEALARVPIEGRWRSGSQPSFRTPDGSVWTHTRQEGWGAARTAHAGQPGPRRARHGAAGGRGGCARPGADGTPRAPDCGRSAGAARQQLDEPAITTVAAPAATAATIRRASEACAHASDGPERYNMTVMIHGPRDDAHLPAQGRGPRSRATTPPRTWSGGTTGTLKTTPRTTTTTTMATTSRPHWRPSRRLPQRTTTTRRTRGRRRGPMRDRGRMCAAWRACIRRKL